MISPKQLLLVIPARYASSRLEAKPLADLEGKLLFERTYNNALDAVNLLPLELQEQVAILVATDDARIEARARDLGIPSLMTPVSCINGTERLLAAYKQLSMEASALNYQGDAPFLPPKLIANLLKTLLEKPQHLIVTGAQVMSWSDLDALRKHKERSPFSGTTVICDQASQARWFSKNIIPALRKEATMRKEDPDRSPVLRHMGIYGFQPEALAKLQTLPPSKYEQLEELEQLRWLEAGLPIYVEQITLEHPLEALGIDSPHDLALARTWLQQKALV